MREPISPTNVIDSFEENDMFDINVRVGFERSWTQAAVRREFSSQEAVDDENVLNRNFVVDAAQYERVRHQLNMGLDIGLYKDLALFINLPLVLSDDRKLSVPSGITEEEAARALFVIDGQANGIRDPETGELLEADHQFFTLPFTSPTRSGLDYLEAGLKWSVFNQYRDGNLPTWVLSASGRFAVGKPMRACNEDARYGDDFTTADVEEDHRCNGGDDPGVSRGTHVLRIETNASKRFSTVEPYVGLGFEFEWVGNNHDVLFPGGDLEGYAQQNMPMKAEFSAGLGIVPWENKKSFQRLTVLLGIKGTYVTSGRDYTPLFDALGTSDSPYLDQPNRESIPGPGNENPILVPFTGVGDVEAHGRISAKLAVDFQPLEFLRVNVGSNFTYITRHQFTTTSACNPLVDAAEDDPRIGLCSEGITNPGHRIAIDLPGRRFSIDNAFTLDIFANVIGQF